MTSTDEPEPVTVAGFHVAEVRAGRPLRLRETVPAKPWSAVTVIVSEPFPPRETCKVAGESEREKSAAELMLNVTFTE
jgi:hypothetical protein